MPEGNAPVIRIVDDVRRLALEARVSHGADIHDVAFAGRTHEITHRLPAAPHPDIRDMRVSDEDEPDLGRQRREDRIGAKRLHHVAEAGGKMSVPQVKLRADKRVYSGTGVSTDIIEASMRAYINALNKIVYEEA